MFVLKPLLYGGAVDVDRAYASLVLGFRIIESGLRLSGSALLPLKYFRLGGLLPPAVGIAVLLLFLKLERSLSRDGVVDLRRPRLRLTL